MKSKIAIFASGKGSNARRLIEYFQDHPQIEINNVLSNRKNALVLDVAEEFGIEGFYFPKEEFEDAQSIIALLRERKVSWIVLAGFLLKVPTELIDHAAGHIINIHPALLPKFGGKGMYGDHVHRAVLENNEQKSGISIHLVDQNYDTGSILAQFECDIEQNESVESLREKVQALEHEHLPKVVEELIIQSIRKK